MWKRSGRTPSAAAFLELHDLHDGVGSPLADPWQWYWNRAVIPRPGIYGDAGVTDIVKGPCIKPRLPAIVKIYV